MTEKLEIVTARRTENTAINIAIENDDKLWNKGVVIKLDQNEGVVADLGNRTPGSETAKITNRKRASKLQTLNHCQ